MYKVELEPITQPTVDGNYWARFTAFAGEQYWEMVSVDVVHRIARTPFDEDDSASLSAYDLFYGPIPEPK